MYCFYKGLFLEGIVGGWVWLGGVIVSLRKVGCEVSNSTPRDPLRKAVAADVGIQSRCPESGKMTIRLDCCQLGDRQVRTWWHLGRVHCVLVAG